MHEAASRFFRAYATVSPSESDDVLSKLNEAKEREDALEL
jgi:hypothetical protein